MTTPTEKKDGFAVIDKGPCWSLIRVGGELVGCEHCECESPKADRVFGETVEKINAAFSSRVRPLVEALEEIKEMLPPPHVDFAWRDAIIEVIEDTLWDFHGK